MKSIIRLTAVAIAASAVLVISCGAGGNSFGEPVSEGSTTAITEVIAKGEGADGESALVEGKVTTVCPSGCWLDVSDDAGNILHVVVAGEYAVPQSLTGKTVRAEGTLRHSPAKGMVELLATGVTVI